MNKHDMLIPVIDIRDGIAVQAIAGDRENYQPLSSIWAKQPCPIQLVHSIQQQTCISTFYLADLTAICNHQLHPDLYGKLLSSGINLQLDVGIRHHADLENLPNHPNLQVILGTESIQGFAALELLSKRLDSHQLIVSLDLKNGQLIAPAKYWTNESPESLTQAIYELGFRRWIILDLAHVGTGNGPITLPFCRDLIQRFPDVEIISGGGVQGKACIDQFYHAGVKQVLVGKSFHDGSLSADSCIQ